jgi:hypothetical protein
MESSKNASLSWGVMIFRERERAGDEEISERLGAPLTIGGHDQGWAALPGYEVAW